MGYLSMSAGADDDGRRLDRLLRKALPELPLSAIHRLLRKGLIRVDGEPGRGTDRVVRGQVIQIPAAAPGTGLPEMTLPSSLPGFPKARQTAGTAKSPGREPPGLDILREEPGLLILNKPAGLAVHGRESLETRVRSYLAGRLSPSLSFRPGPLHRLDRNTSGVIVFSSSLEGARRFSALIREGGVTKRYLALAEGLIPGEEDWEDYLVRDKTLGKTFPAEKTGPGKRALTRVRPLGTARDRSLVMLEITTGRTHQIRAQAAARGHPLWGDVKYGGQFRRGGFFLHACFLEFAGDRRITVRAPVPAPFRDAIRGLFGNKFMETLDFPSRGSDVDGIL
jgi:23S rRNA pseudouridine955/2504/2580 synthase